MPNGSTNTDGARSSLKLDALLALGDVDLDPVSRGVRVTGAGVIKGTFADDTVAVEEDVEPGEIYPFWFKQIEQTGTTATGITVYR